MTVGWKKGKQEKMLFERMEVCAGSVRVMRNVCVFFLVLFVCDVIDIDQCEEMETNRPEG